VKRGYLDIDGEVAEYFPTERGAPEKPPREEKARLGPQCLKGGRTTKANKVGQKKWKGIVERSTIRKEEEEREEKKRKRGHRKNTSLFA